MEQKSKGHWTSDETLVEDFVLRRLGNARQRELNTHLRECEACRKVIEREMRVAATVRAYGREALKKRLKESIDASSVRAVPWPHIASAAAVVLIVIGLGLYGRWFIPESEMPEVGEQPPVSAREMEPPSADVEGGGRREEAARLGAARDEQAKRSVSPEDVAAPATKEEAPMKLRLDEVGRAYQPEGGGFWDRRWIDGIVVDRDDLRYKAPGAAQRRLQKTDAATAEGMQSQQVQKKTGSAQTFSLVHKNVRQTISLMQQARGQLPMEQQLKEKDYSQERIPTLLERTDSGLSMTIYSDELTQTGQVTVDPITGDSLVVGIGERKIGYRIPGGWGQDLNSLKIKK